MGMPVLAEKPYPKEFVAELASCIVNFATSNDSSIKELAVGLAKASIMGKAQELFGDKLNDTGICTIDNVFISRTGFDGQIRILDSGKIYRIVVTGHTGQEPRFYSSVSFMKGFDDFFSSMLGIYTSKLPRYGVEYSGKRPELVSGFITDGLPQPDFFVELAGSDRYKLDELMYGFGVSLGKLEEAQLIEFQHYACFPYSLFLGVEDDSDGMRRKIHLLLQTTSAVRKSNAANLPSALYFVISPGSSFLRYSSEYSSGGDE